jgi:RNA recognition motif-containing protein
MHHHCSGAWTSRSPCCRKPPRWSAALDTQILPRHNNTQVLERINNNNQQSTINNNNGTDAEESRTAGALGGMWCGRGSKRNGFVLVLSCPVVVVPSFLSLPHTRRCCCFAMPPVRKRVPVAQSATAKSSSTSKSCIATNSKSIAEADPKNTNKPKSTTSSTTAKASTSSKTSSKKGAKQPEPKPLPGTSFYAVVAHSEHPDSNEFPSHILYLRQLNNRPDSHKQRHQATDADGQDADEYERQRTLVVHNLPIFVTLEQIRSAFGACGSIESIAFGQQPSASDRARLARWKRRQRASSSNGSTVTKSLHQDFDLNRVAGLTAPASPDPYNDHAQPQQQQQPRETQPTLSASDRSYEASKRAAAVLEQAARHRSQSSNYIDDDDDNDDDDDDGDAAGGDGEIVLLSNGFAHVVFHDKSSVQKALRLTSVCLRPLDMQRPSRGLECM